MSSAYLTARPGDVGFTRGVGWLQNAIRDATRSRGEPPSVVNHTLLFTSSGLVAPLEPGIAVPESDQARCVEALWHVEHRHWWKAHHGDVGSTIYVYRPLFLDEEAAARVVRLALRHEGQRYGWWKLLFQLADHVAPWDDKKLSRLLRVDSRPICSYLVADSFAEAGWPQAFGTEVPPQAQDPDDQWDYCKLTANGYEDERGDARRWQFVGEATVA